MKNGYKLAIAFASLTLIGAGCAAQPSYQAPGAQLNLPDGSAGEQGDMMKDEHESATGTMTEDGQEGDRMKSATATEMEKGEEGDRMESATGAMMEGSKDDEDGAMMEDSKDKEGAMMDDEGAAR